MKLRDLYQILKEAGVAWLEDKAPRLGAALAYYTAFSLAPLLLIAVAIAGLVFGQRAARGQLHDQLNQMVGEEGASALQTMLIHASQPASSTWATVIGVVLLFVGATSLFGQLQDALNTVWKVQPRPGRSMITLVRDRVVSFLMVLGTGLLLLVTLIASTLLPSLGRYLGWWQSPLMAQTLNFISSLVLLTFLFAMIFRFLPDVIISWKDVWLGAAVTSLLFSAGKFLIGLYLTHSAVASTYGAAGSFAVLLIWLYYSAQIFLFGAELTKTYANHCGSQIVPSANAELLNPNGLAVKGSSQRPSACLS